VLGWTSPELTEKGTAKMNRSLVMTQGGESPPPGCSGPEPRKQRALNSFSLTLHSPFVPGTISPAGIGGGCSTGAQTQGLR
jgi:hypothetical protein